MANKRRKKGWSIQDKMALLIFLLMSGTLIFCAGLAVQQVVIRATNTGPLDITFEEYERSEMALDDSTENVLYQATEQKEDGGLSVAEEKQAAETESEKAGRSREEPGTEIGEGEEKESEKSYDLTDQVKIPKTDYPFYVKVNRLENCVTVYTLDKKGRYSVPVKAMICSVGLHGNTPLGKYKTSTKYKWRELYGHVFGQYAYRIHNSIMFHSVPYFSPNKDDLETEEYNKLGEAASLGCVRLSVADAKWLVENCPSGTTVEIYEGRKPGPLGRPEAIKIDTKSKDAGWDPTDPDKKNPWHKDKK